MDVLPASSGSTSTGNGSYAVHSLPTRRHSMTRRNSVNHQPNNKAAFSCTDLGFEIFQGSEKHATTASAVPREGAKAAYIDSSARASLGPFCPWISSGLRLAPDPPRLNWGTLTTTGRFLLSKYTQGLSAPTVSLQIQMEPRTRRCNRNGPAVCSSMLSQVTLLSQEQTHQHSNKEGPPIP